MSRFYKSPRHAAPAVMRMTTSAALSNDCRLVLTPRLERGAEAPRGACAAQKPEGLRFS
jgi:hypothetical protein